MFNLWTAVFTNPYNLLRKAIPSRPEEFGKKTEPSNAVGLSFLHPTIQTKSLSNPYCDHDFSQSDVFNLSSNMMLTQIFGRFIISPFSPATHSRVLDFLI